MCRQGAGSLPQLLGARAGSALVFWLSSLQKGASMSAQRRFRGAGVSTGRSPPQGGAQMQPALMCCCSCSKSQISTSSVLLQRAQARRCIREGCIGNCNNASFFLLMQDLIRLVQGAQQGSHRIRECCTGSCRSRTREGLGLGGRQGVQGLRGAERMAGLPDLPGAMQDRAWQLCRGRAGRLCGLQSLAGRASG